MTQDWSPAPLARDKPVYLAIADALEGDISQGRLQNGDKLPTQRKLARLIGVDFTTITRAYGEAKKRGLIAARVGQGTFVQGPPENTRSHNPSKKFHIDMGMNMPPVPTDPRVITRMHHEMNEVVHRQSTRSLFGYQDFIGSHRERTQAAGWVQSFFPQATPDRLLICSGTQSALLSLSLNLFKPGDLVVSEELTYPGFRILMRQLGINHQGLAMDEDGILPAAFREACRTRPVKALYCTPTLHNPTTTTWPESRRVAIAAIARDYNVKIIEDDAYGAMAVSPPRPLSCHAPERSYYIIGLAKCLASALRISFLCVPDLDNFQSLALSQRATSMMASPITKAMALQLLSSGCSEEVKKDIQKETAARQNLAREILPRGSFKADPHGFQVWLKLPDSWDLQEFLAILHSKGIRLIGADAFALASPAPKAVRICLGVPHSTGQTGIVLNEIASVLRASPLVYNGLV